MEDSLPLLPNKPDAVCADVRGVLREVFREAGVCRSGGGRGGGGEVAAGEWELVRGRARELARPGGVAEVGTVSRVTRAALLPALTQHAAARTTLWVRQLTHTHMPPLLTAALPSSPHKHTQRPPDPIPDMKCCAHKHPDAITACVIKYDDGKAAVACVPERVDFVNFCIGREYQVEVRLLNVSDLKLKLAVVPPTHRELTVQRASRKGGAIGGDLFAGSVRRLLITFRPQSRRAFTDFLQVRNSLGQTLRVPILCYLQPPLLEVVVPGPGSGAVEDMDGGTEWCSVGEEVELGARLLGDTHHSPLLLRCKEQHAAFFLVDEESWVAGAVSYGGDAEGVVSADGGWAVRPRAWAGGGVLHGQVWARAHRPGLFLAALRVLCSTAIARPLMLLADSLLYRPDHVTLHAHDRNYDICDGSDDACDHYLNLGASFPNQTLSSTIQITNHSPVSYSYYWKFREWGECWCARGIGSALCDRAKKYSNEMIGESFDVSTENQLNNTKVLENKNVEPKNYSDKIRSTLKVSQEEGELYPRSSSLATISVDATMPAGSYKTVLMLILKNIPMESIPSDCEVDIVNKKRLPLDLMPGETESEHEVADVVSAQMEVWWEVCELRYAVSPACVCLRTSRGAEVPLRLRATLLAPAVGAVAHWRLPPRLDQSHHERSPLHLDAGHSVTATLYLTLPHLPDSRSDFDIISLESDDHNGKWYSQCIVERRSYQRHPRFGAPRNWCGIIFPSAPVSHNLTLINDTYQNIIWHTKVYRLWHELGPRTVCLSKGGCGVCYDRACTCDLLEPQSGALSVEERAELQYRVHAPPDEGCVATLVVAQRGPTSKPNTEPPITGRACLVTYRTLFTRLVLQVLPCREHDTGPCGVCVCEEEEKHSPLLRVCLLTVGETRTRRIRIHNLTPLPATGCWLPSPIIDDIFEVTFIPNEFHVEGYGNTEISVEVSARGVSGRRVYVRAANVAHSRRPLYLLFILSATGVAIDVEFPAPNIRRVHLHQRRFISPNRSDKQIFEDEDNYRAKIIRNLCQCKQSLHYIEPISSIDRPQVFSETHIPIITEPPPLTRVCECTLDGERPLSSVREDLPCIQIFGARIGEVTHGTLRLVSQCRRPVRWRATLRYSDPLLRKIVRAKADEELWAGESEAGLCALVSPAKGFLQGREGRDVTCCVELSVRVRGTAWGVYRDQLLIEIEQLEPFVVFVWVEVVGPALRPALAPRAPLPHHPLPAPRTSCHDSVIANVWMSGREPRGVYVTNVTSCPVTVYPYLVRELEMEHNVLPFRLYFRFNDELSPYCPCMEENCEQSDDSSKNTQCRIELYLTADYGIQDGSYYKVYPDKLEISNGACGVFYVRTTLVSEPLYGDVAPEHTLLLQSEAIEVMGEWWCRPSVLPVALRVKVSCAIPRLVAPIKTYVAKVNGITIAKAGILNLRKYVRLQNVGEGSIECCVRVSTPWRLVNDDGSEEVQVLPLCLCARSATQLCAMVCLNAKELCPEEVPNEDLAEAESLDYPPRVMLRSTMEVYDSRTVLETISLVVDVELPHLVLKPDRYDFGFVCDGVVKKTYFTVSHTSKTETIEVEVEWRGAEEFCLYPRRVSVGPGAERQVYLQYRARWRASPAAGAVVVRAGTGGGAGAGDWCRAVAAVCACPTRDHKWRVQPHDYTDTDTPAQLILAELTQ